MVSGASAHPRHSGHPTVLLPVEHESGAGGADVCRYIHNRLSQDRPLQRGQGRQKRDRIQQDVEIIDRHGPSALGAHEGRQSGSP